MSKLIRPSVASVKITDSFWKPYLNMIRNVTMPYVFKKFEETEFFKGFHRVAENFRDEYKTPPFDNGLIFESIRGACDFLAQEYDSELDAMLDGYIELWKQISTDDGKNFSDAERVDFDDTFKTCRSFLVPDIGGYSDIALLGEGSIRSLL